MGIGWVLVDPYDDASLNLLPVGFCEFLGRVPVFADAQGDLVQLANRAEDFSDAKWTARPAHDVQRVTRVGRPGQQPLVRARVDSMFLVPNDLLTLERDDTSEGFDQLLLLEDGYVGRVLANEPLEATESMRVLDD